MKNQKVFGIIVLLAVIGFTMTSCTTTSKEMYKGSTSVIAPAAKDVEILGVVRVETNVDKNGNGDKVTYDALLKLAEAKGGNGIVNVMIDRKVTEQSIFGYLLSREYTYYGSALAVKYTNSVPVASPNALETKPASASGGIFSALGL